MGALRWKLGNNLELWVYGRVEGHQLGQTPACFHVVPPLVDRLVAYTKQDTVGGVAWDGKYQNNRVLLSSPVKVEKLQSVPVWFVAAALELTLEESAAVGVSAARLSPVG